MKTCVPSGKHKDARSGMIRKDSIMQVVSLDDTLIFLPVPGTWSLR